MHPRAPARGPFFLPIALSDCAALNEADKTDCAFMHLGSRRLSRSSVLATWKQCGLNAIAFAGQSPFLTSLSHAMPPQRKGITCCDTTDHGGRVLEGYATMKHKGHRVAGKGHMVFCPQCNGVFPIIEATGSFLGYAPTLDGMRTGCGARLIASHDDLWFDDDSETITSTSRDNTKSSKTPSAPKPIGAARRRPLTWTSIRVCSSN